MQSENRRKLIDVLVSGGVGVVAMNTVYGRLLHECPACVDAHPGTFLALVGLGAVGASTLLRALIVLSRRALSRRALSRRPLWP